MIKIGKNIDTDKYVGITSISDIIDKESNSMTMNINTIIVGKTGTKKAFILKNIIEQLINNENEDIVVIDTFGNYKELEGNNINIITPIDTSTDLTLRYKNLETILDNINKKDDNRSKTIIIDECHNFVGKSKSLDEKFINNIRESRDNNIRYIVASQSISDFNNNILSLFKESIQLFINESKIDNSIEGKFKDIIEKYNEDNKIFAIIKNIDKQDIICKI